MKDSDRDPEIGESTVSMRRPVLFSSQQKIACLVVIQGTEIGRDYRLRKRSLILGRDSEAEIMIPDDAASRRHARIDFQRGDERDRYRLTDLDSTNSTFVNGRTITSMELNDGDKVQVGGTVLRFSLLDEIDARFHREVRDRLRFDAVTGLLTKESLILAMEQELKRAIAYHLPLSALMMDLDHFKQVNDTHGHLIGTKVLTEVGRRLRVNFRAGDVTGRYGGEEFVSYLSETSAESAVVAAERVRTKMETNPFEFDGAKLQVTISIGIAGFPEHGSDVTTLLGRADTALYRCKAKGRNLILVAD